MDEERRPLLPGARSDRSQSLLGSIYQKIRKNSLVLSLILAFIALVSLAIFTSFGLTDALISQEAQKILSAIRLPKHVQPILYDLDFETDMDELTFQGIVDIKINVTAKDRFIALHYSELNLWDGILYSLDEKEKVSAIITPTRNSTYDATNKILFEFASPLEIGLYRLSIKYSGILTDTLRGYYKAKVVDNGKHSKYIATTQFEPTDARKAFPCFDEPAFKAVFNIRMTVPNNHHALSNMPVKKIQHVADHKNKYIFQPTVKMSTYLVAFIVSDFEAVSGKTNRGIDVAVWTAKGKTEQGRYALHVGIKALEYYERAYKINYPLPKMDMIAIPDFAAGAMENWGLVTYRDTSLLYDEKLSSASNKQWVAEVIAHELAHQWFGDWTTLSWWSDTWLNEGFAQFMEYKGTDAVEPYWKMMDQFVSADVVRSLHADASVFTHPIAANVQNPEEIQEIFDDISYGKGATVLRMLEMWLDQVAAPGHFLDSIHNYLLAHSYGNAKTADLWHALDTQDVSVGEFMSTWIDQPGFPVVIVENGQAPGEYMLRQERFFYGRMLNKDDWENLLEGSNVEGGIDMVLKNNQTWIIQASVTDWNPRSKVSDSKDTILTLKDKTPVAIKMDSPAHLPIVNLHHAGAFHTLYTPDILATLSNALLKDPNVLPPLDRAGLLVDSFALCWSGRMDSVAALMDLTKFLEFEHDTNVWKTAIQEFNVLEAALSLHSSYGYFLKYQRKLMTNIVKDLGWTEESADETQWHVRSLLRSELLSEMIAVEDPLAVRTALDYFRAMRNKHIASEEMSLDAQTLNVIYDTGVIYGDEDDYNWVMQLYTETTFAADQERMLHALASTRKPYLQHRTLEFAISGKVRKQDVMWLIRQVALLGGPTGPVMVWTFLRTNWDRLVKFWEGGDWTKLNEMIATLVSRFRQKSLVEDVERLFLRKEDDAWFVPPRAEISIRKGLEKSMTRIAWTERYGVELEQWLHQAVDGSHNA